MKRNRNAIDRELRDLCQDGKRWRASQAERVMHAWKEGGLSKTEFARQHGLKIERLERWFSKLERARRRKPSKVVLRPVRLEGPKAAPPNASGDLEVLIGDDVRLRLRPGFDPEDVEKLIRVLRC